MSDLIRQQGQAMQFTAGAWVILNPVEQSIKAKIEKLGTPLKDWDISINYGIKTGCNEAFIISGDKKDELISKDKKSAEIIRPILRGRDIKRYGYEFADLYLIATFPSRHYNIDDFSAIKDYLENFGKDDEEYLREYGKDCWGKRRLGQTGARGARKKTNNKWFETQDSISYSDDFSKQKIVYREIGFEMDACLVGPNIFINNKLYFIVGENLEYLLIILNSKIFNQFLLPMANATGGKGNDFMKKISIPTPSDKQLEQSKKLLNLGINDQLDQFVYQIFGLTNDEIRYIKNIK
jgi:hypothetical protein